MPSSALSSFSSATTTRPLGPSPAMGMLATTVVVPPVDREKAVRPSVPMDWECARARISGPEGPIGPDPHG